MAKTFRRIEMLEKFINKLLQAELTHEVFSKYKKAENLKIKLCELHYKQFSMLAGR